MAGPTGCPAGVRGAIKLKRLRQSARSDPASVERLFAQGTRHLTGGDAEGAEACFRQALQIDPDVPEAVLHGALSLRPRDAASWTDLGVLHACHHRALSLDPLLDSACVNLAYVPLRIGLVWRGNPACENDADHLVDCADTAAVVAQLDLVIAVDTAVAHLAGALGRPCWLLLPHYKTDWRWLTERTDTPWYPGMRLFRQAAGESWAEVVARVAQVLRTRGLAPGGFPAESPTGTGPA